jgi:hypothetical protein
VHLVLAVTGLVWVAGQHQAVSTAVWLAVLLSIGLDFLLAGSEIFHRVRLHQLRSVRLEYINHQCAVLFLVGLKYG